MVPRGRKPKSISMKALEGKPGKTPASMSRIIVLENTGGIVDDMDELLGGENVGEKTETG